MGYTTNFKGESRFTSEPTASQLALIKAMFDEDCRDHPEWGARGGGAVSAGTYTTATNDPAHPSTAAEILAKIGEAQKQIGRMQADLHGALSGMRIFSSPYLPNTITEPIKKHKRRRWMSERYCKRIQKKWTKRFGTREVQVAYMINGGLCVPPGVLDDLRRVTRLGWLA